MTNAIAGKDNRGVTKKPMDEAIERFNKAIKKKSEPFGLKFTCNDLLEIENTDLKNALEKAEDMKKDAMRKYRDLKDTLEHTDNMLEDTIREHRELKDKYDAIKLLLSPDKLCEFEYIQKREKEDENERD